MLPENREDALVLCKLRLVGRPIDFELRNHQRQARGCQSIEVSLRDLGVDRRGEGMALNRHDIDEIFLLKQLHDGEVAFGGLLGIRHIILIHDELRVREVFARHTEGGEYPIPASRSRPAERFVVVSALRIVLVSVPGRIIHRLVHHLDIVQRRVALGDLRVTFRELLELLLRRKLADPGRLLISPDERMEAEGEPIVLRQGVGLVERAPVQLVADGLKRRPFPGVFRRHLVPVVGEALELRPRPDVPEKFRGRISLVGRLGCGIGARRSPGEKERWSDDERPGSPLTQVPVRGCSYGRLGHRETPVRVTERERCCRRGERAERSPRCWIVTPV